MKQDKNIPYPYVSIKVIELNKVRSRA